jgi:hypothetical protein
MHVRSIPANSIPASTPNLAALDNKKGPTLSEAAVMLLPGLHHARSLLDVAIRVLAHFANEHPHAVSDAEAAARLRRLLAAFGWIT